MKRILLSSWVALLAITGQTQIIDIPISASSTSVGIGQSTTISTTGSEIGINYSLRNSSNVVVDGPLEGTGGNLSFNTGPLSTAETFSLLAEANSQGITLDGTNDYLQASIPASFNYSAAYTIETWVKSPLPGSSGHYPIFCAGNSTGNDIEIYVQKNTNNLIVVHNRANGGTIQSATYNSPPDNVWYHLAVTYDGTNIEIFYDGVSQGTVGASVPLESTGAEINIGYIGSSAWPSSFGARNFQGQLDDYRLWSAAKSGAEINANMANCLSGSESDLVAFYQFNEGTGTTANDELGSNNATFVNMDAYSNWSVIENLMIPCNNIINWQREMSQEVTISAIVGLEENSLNPHLLVYPNPAQGQLTLNTTEKINNVHIIDLRGKTIMNNATSSSYVDVSGLSKGIYLIQVTTNSGVVTRRFVKE